MLYDMWRGKKTGKIACDGRKMRCVRGVVTKATSLDLTHTDCVHKCLVKQKGVETKTAVDCVVGSGYEKTSLCGREREKRVWI